MNDSITNRGHNPIVHIRTILLAAFALALIGSARAADSVDGKWKGEFENQIGLQKYTFEFKVDGDKLTGRAIGERRIGTNNVAITDGKITDDTISFVEPAKYEDVNYRIEYTGTVAGDEIKLHRKVADYSETDFVVKRVKEMEPNAEAKPEAGADTNSPPANP